MNRPLNRIISVLLFSFFAGSSFAQSQMQNPGADTLETRVKIALTNHYKKYPPEKLFLHTDRSVYVSGQTIWYKGYATAYGKPSQLSKIMYVQLTDDNGKILVKNKLLLKDGGSHGNIDLPDSLHTGWYQLRSFTAWMVNFGEDGFYHQKIYIQNRADTSSHVVNHSPKRYYFSFFPEGGDLIEGNICNIAFKATDENGAPVNMEGEVRDNNKKVIAKLIVQHDGMGLFTMEGYAGIKYTAAIHFPGNTVENFDLPGFKKAGLNMQVNALPADEIGIKVIFSGGIKAYGNVVIAAFQNNGLVNTYPLQLSNGVNIFGLKKNDFATGILRLTLFNYAGLPEAERIVFINKHDQLALKLEADTLSFQPRSKSAFKLTATDGQGHFIPSNFSVAVTDADAVKDNPEDDNIYSSLLLTSELKGKIYNPAYYFKNNSDSLQRQLDLVMLTNGWRHFKWDEVLSNSPIALKYPVETSQFIAGKIPGYHPAAGDKNQLQIKLVIANGDSTTYIGYVTPDSTGSFILRDYNHSGISKMYVEAVDAKNRKQRIGVKFLKTGIDTVQLARDTIAGYAETVPSINHALLNNTINEQRAELPAGGIVLEAVDIKSKKISLTDLVIKNHVNNFTAEPAFTLDLVNYPYPDIGIIPYIQGRFPGLQVYGDDNNASFLYHGGNSLATGAIGHLPAGPENAPSGGAFLPYFYLNESSIFFADLKDIPLNDVALIRFVPPPVWFAPFNGGNVGALLIYTKNQQDDMETFKKVAFDHYTFNGYSITREFYSPDYNQIKTNSARDNRSTLYWSHDLDTDSKDNAKFHFYNSDKAKKYRIIIQGIDANGKLGYLNEVF